MLRDLPPMALQHVVGLMALVYTLIIIATGIVPLAAIGTLGDTPHDLFVTRVTHATGADVMFNIMLYVPLGALYCAGLSRRACRPRNAWLPAALLALGLSVAIEWTQAYSPARVSSMIDVVANTAGALVGALLATATTATWPRMLGAALFELHTRPRGALVRAYCLGLVLVGVMPLSIAWDAAQVRTALKNASFVPFATARLEPNPYPPAEHEAFLQAEYARIAVMKRYARWALEAVSFGLLVWLLLPVLRDQYGFKRWGAVALTLWSTALLAAAISALQLMILTRGFDATDIVARLAGAWITLAAIAWPQPRHLDPDDAPHARPGFRTTALVFTTAYLLYVGLIPWRFDADLAALHESLASSDFLPFHAYFQARPHLMLDDMVDKVIAYLAWGIALGSILRLRGMPTGTRAMLGAVTAVALSATVELAQAFSPARVASLTDPLLAAIGAVVGITVHHHAVSFYRFALTHDMYGPRDDRADQNLGPLDLAIASLAEPRRDAPRERAPDKRHAHRRSPPA